VLALAVALAAGASVSAGVPGAFVLIAVALLMVLAFGSIGLFAAAKTGSTAQVQGLFAIALGLLFMSSMIMPRNLVSADWFETIATYNPMSYLVEATRSLLITGWDAQALALGCGIAALMLLVGLSATVATLKRSVLRT
jgi:ABC-2 type transport system permease protein